MAKRKIEMAQGFFRMFADDKELTRQLNQTEARIRATGSAITKIGATAAGAGAAITGAFAVPVKLAADLQQTQVAFDVLTGDAVKAKQLLQDLREFAAATPFQLVDLTDASKKLLAFGSDAKAIPEELRRIGDISAGIGAPIGEIAELYGKARVQGRLFQEDINQLQGRGINITKELAKQFRVQETEVRALTSAGKVGFKNLEEAFKSLTSGAGIFTGIMERMSGTLGGRFSTLKDSIAEALLPIGEALIPPLQTIIELADSAVTAFGKFAEENAALAVPVAALGAGLLIAGTATTALGAAMYAAAPAVKAFGFGISIASTAVKALWVTITAHPIGALITALAGVIAYWLTFTDSGKAAIDTIFGLFDSLTTFLSTRWESVWGGIRKTILDVADFFGRIWGNVVDTIGALFIKVRGFFDRGFDSKQALADLKAAREELNRARADELQGAKGNIDAETAAAIDEINAAKQDKPTEAPEGPDFLPGLQQAAEEARREQPQIGPRNRPEGPQSSLDALVEEFKTGMQNIRRTGEDTAGTLDVFAESAKDGNAAWASFINDFNKVEFSGFLNARLAELAGSKKATQEKADSFGTFNAAIAQQRVGSRTQEQSLRYMADRAKEDRGNWRRLLTQGIPVKMALA